ncbi:hypothetical protein Tco_0837149 [Tanacetum coccineum]
MWRCQDNDPLLSHGRNHKAWLITLWLHGLNASTIHGLLSLEESRDMGYCLLRNQEYRGHVGGLEGDEEGLLDVLVKLETSFGLFSQIQRILKDGGEGTWFQLSQRFITTCSDPTDKYKDIMKAQAHVSRLPLL